MVLLATKLAFAKDVGRCRPPGSSAVIGFELSLSEVCLNFMSGSRPHHARSLHLFAFLGRVGMNWHAVTKP